MARITTGSPSQPTQLPDEIGDNKSAPSPNATTEYATWLASSLANYESLARTLVKHRAEKGRIVESIVKSALRSILPGRFSIGTGFAITASGRTSSQLDLVIYDGLYNSPIILEGGTGLFPIECVYGFVEVKSRLNVNAIDEFTKAVRTVRDLADEKRYVVYGEGDDKNGHKVVKEFEVSNALPPRSFMFAINSEYSDIRNAESALKEYTEINKAHIHGMAVLDKDWFFRQLPYETPHQFICTESQSLAAFCAAVLATIQSVNVLPASMKRYLGIT